MTKISVIIPAWREGVKVVEQASIFSGLDGVEVIAALAEADSRTEEPHTALNIKVARSQKGRARQMNSGAAIATGDILLFLHSDTTIDPDTLDEVREALSQKEVAGGAYRLKIGGESLLLKFFSIVANVRSLLFNMPYGDQAIFVRREVFERIGRFPDVPLLEDVLLVDRLKKEGLLIILPFYAETSPRRWEAGGVFTVTAKNWAIMIAFRLGASPERLSRWYSGKG